MAYRVRAKFEIDWVPDGTAGALLGQPQADNPGYGATVLFGLDGPVGAAQTASFILGEMVPGGDAPTAANFQTAFTAAGTDAFTIANTAGYVPGFTSGTLVALMQAWAQGQP